MNIITDNSKVNINLLKEIEKLKEKIAELENDNKKIDGYITKDELRGHWMELNPPKYGDFRSSWEYPIYNENKCHGHGDYSDEEVANIEYVYWLEERLIKAK